VKPKNKINCFWRNFYFDELPRPAELGCEGTIIGKAIYEGSYFIENTGKLYIRKMLIKKEIIPCLDIKNGRTVKGVNFVDL
jgi:phosphoribosylformimino-5-aminoimidazole carboxamide ribonucleotide (ProFAR) isomerase